MMCKKIGILGSTGSIGTQTLSVVKNLHYQVTTLAAYKNISLLEKQAREYSPSLVCIYDKGLYKDLKQRLSDTPIQVVAGHEGLCEAAVFADSEIVLNAVVGMIGLEPTLKAIDAKKDIALANKETLVVGGQLVMTAAKEKNIKILPVDSEHSAIFQSLQGNQSRAIRRIILTASGGPFFGKTRQEIAQVTVKEALSHPNWAMGNKITIDSATLMNKGLEFIEALWLFDLAPQDIEIVIHRESILHSAVEYCDGSIIGQMGVPDMRIPIQYALTYPARVPSEVQSLSFTQIGKLTFQKPDEKVFTCLSACKQAIRMGGVRPAVINGANEEAVSLFLNHKISFLQIGEIVRSALSIPIQKQEMSLENILKADALGRNYVRERFL